MNSANEIAKDILARYGVLLAASDVAEILHSTATSVLVRSRCPRTATDRVLAAAKIHIGRRAYWRPCAIAALIADAMSEVTS